MKYILEEDAKKVLGQKFELLNDAPRHEIIITEWKLKEVNGENFWVCGNCGFPPKTSYWLEPRYPYCPYCGARIVRKGD